MLIFALAFVLGEVLAIVEINVIWALLLIPVLIIIKVITKPGRGCIVMTFIFVLVGYYAMVEETSVYNEMHSIDECDGIVTGKLTGISKNSYGYTCKLSDVTITYEEEMKECKRFMVQMTDMYDNDNRAVKIGNNITITGNICQFSNARNPGNFDVSAYYKSLGYYAYISADNVYTDGKTDNIQSVLYEFKEEAKICIDNICSDKYAGIFKAVLLGDKSDVDDNVESLYRENGIGHLLAISGLHITIIGMCIYKLMRKRCLFVTSGCISMGVIVLFGIMTGLGISTMRAVVMFGIKLLAEMTGRTYDIISSASMAAIIILFDNPFVIFNFAFQISFGAVFAAGIVMKVLDDFLRLKKGIVSKIMKSLLFSISVNLVVNPIIARNYFELPSYGVLINLIVIPLMNVVLISGIFGVAVGMIGMGLNFSFLSGVAKILIKPGCFVLMIYENICTVISKIPYSNIVVGKPSNNKLIFYYAILVLFLVSIYFLTIIRNKYEEEKEKDFMDNYPKEGVKYRKADRREENRIKTAVRASVTLLCICCLSIALYLHNYQGLYITFMDVGQGDGIFIRNGEGNTYMIDGGSSDVKNASEYRIVPYLKSVGAGEIDYVFITHMDSDHTSGIIEMLESQTIKINNVVLPDIAVRDDAYNEFEKLAETSGTEVIYIKTNDSIKEALLSIDCLYPLNNIISEDRNDCSTILSINYGDFSGLFTGDIGMEFEKYFYDELSYDYTLLKVAHHGSKYSSSNEFLQKVNPLISIISCGVNNNYGHPSSELLDRLYSINTDILRTDISGAISIWTDGKKIKIDTYIDS